MYTGVKSILLSNLFYHLQISVRLDWTWVFFAAESVTRAMPSLLQVPYDQTVIQCIHPIVTSSPLQLAWPLEQFLAYQWRCGIALMPYLNCRLKCTKKRCKIKWYNAYTHSCVVTKYYCIPYSLNISRGNIFKVEPDIFQKELFCGKIFTDLWKN